MWSERSKLMQSLKSLNLLYFTAHLRGVYLLSSQYKVPIKKNSSILAYEVSQFLAVLRFKALKIQFKSGLWLA